MNLGLSTALPEILLVAGASALLLGGACNAPRSLLHYSSILLLLLAANFALEGYPPAVATSFNGMFAISPMATVLKLGVLLSCAGALAYSRLYLAERGILGGEYSALALFAAAGMLLLISAAHFITLYMGLELMSLSLYAMIAMRRDDPAAIEAAMKYFVLGALASGMILYGISLVYGVSGSLALSEVAREVAAMDPSGRPVLAIGLVFIVAGVAFKLGVAPFHMWLPDVYHGAPSATVAFIASGPKIAALALALRLLAEALGSLAAEWAQMIVILIVVSLLVGNVTAIAQSNIKRMLAYSAISHSGFVLIGVLADTSIGYAGAMFYILVYALTTVGAFGMIALLSQGGIETEQIADLKGLAKRNGLAAALLLILMLSLAGVPPMVGFYAKFAVLAAAVDAGWTWVAVVAVVFSVVGAFYYLRVVKFMYFDAPEGAVSARKSLSRPQAILALANGVMIVILGILPGSLMAVCLRAVEASL